MKIHELYLKNFGKFTDKSIHLSDGINILYGENESGKSTIHTFIKSMLFGLERGRGRASVNDTFSVYEPWENPNYYAGEMKFESGGRNFCISRNFDKYSRSAELICEDDGEELSVEDGDLDMILDGLTEAVYENTISIGQLKSEPAKPLAEELKNFAANYYAAGDGDIDLSGALDYLKERRKVIEKEADRELRRKQEKREKLEQEASYIWRDIHKFREERECLLEEIENRREKERKENNDEACPVKWRIHPVEIIFFILLVIIPFLLIPKPWSFLVAIILFLCCGIYVWNRMKVGKKQEKTEPERILEEITPEEEKAPVEKLIWEKERISQELKEKEIQYGNLQEQLEELEEMSDEFKQQEKKRLAVAMAEEKIRELSGQMQSRLKTVINENVSEIIERITGGKYTRLLAEDDLTVRLMHDGKKVGIERLSRGTVEQIYFALRMTGAQTLYEEEFPIILDDTFVYYDDSRLENTLKWLCENKKQVLIFTCQRREEEALVRMNIPYSKERI